MKKSFLLAPLLFLIFTLDAAIERRAAFDFGSGKIKLQVADVDTETHQILDTLYNDGIIVLLSQDLAHQPDQKLSRKIQDKAIEAAHALKQKATQLGATQFHGIATEAYRMAENGDELIARYQNELSLPVTIISQEEEGKFGFFALIKEKNLDPRKVICWDTGAGSFQITYLNSQGEAAVYKGPFGRSTTTNALIAQIKKRDPQKTKTPNPVSREEWDALMLYMESTLAPLPDDLKAKLKEPGVQLIAIGSQPDILRQLGSYHASDVGGLLMRRLNKTDAQLQEEHPTPRDAVSELARVAALMRKLRVDKVDYIRTTSGSSSHLLTTEEFWQPQP